jgi:hypothetical protein
VIQKQKVKIYQYITDKTKHLKPEILTAKQVEIEDIKAYRYRLSAESIGTAVVLERLFFIISEPLTKLI